MYPLREMIFSMYYVVSLPEKNGLEFLSPYIFMEHSGGESGYIDYSPREYMVKGFSSFESAVLEARLIFKTLAEHNSKRHVEFAKGLYVLDHDSDKLSEDLTPYIVRGLECISDLTNLKGEIELDGK